MEKFFAKVTKLTGVKSLLRPTSIFLMLLVALPCSAQTTAGQMGDILKQEIVAPQVADFALRRYIADHVAPPPELPSSPQAWDAEEGRLRKHLLTDVVFHGWPAQWVNSPSRFEQVGSSISRPGYRFTKLRYEIVPGFQSTAILYEPEKLQGKMPAILNLYGHVGPLGKSIEFEQKRCINLARHGIVALNLEWLAYGELDRPGNEHWFGAHLDLVGVNELGLFYLLMRRGLDYLYDRPDVDRDRLGVTGLSGGGWQTIMLGSLDERVKVAVPVAGFSSMRTRVEVREHGDLGDIEQSASDLLQGQDYTHLIAMMAPRPTLLVYNAEDDCCFRGPLVKPSVYDATRPFFRLYGKEESLQWHENRDPSNHNYQLDNRQAAYRFFSREFGLPALDDETGVAQEIKTYDELEIGLPKDNLTILDLARKVAHEIARDAIPASGLQRDVWAGSQRQRLQQVVRLEPARIAAAWPIANTKAKGLETKSYLFEMDDGLMVPGVWLKAIDAPEEAPVTIVLNDKGKEKSGQEVSDRVNRGEQVLALDLLFTGTAWSLHSQPYDTYEQILDGVGKRPLGIEAAQLIEVSRWMKEQGSNPAIRLEVTGVRNQMAALVAAAIKPNLFSTVVVHEGLRSLSILLDGPIPFSDAPDLFCLDLYKYFDVDSLTALTGATKVTLEHQVEIPRKP